MSANKTVQTKQSVQSFLDTFPDSAKKQDALKILEWMKEITQEEPKLWGDSLVGFGSYHYKYESGREGDFFLIGFSIRKQNIPVYIISGFEHFQEDLDKLGKHKTGSSCLYLNKLKDVDEAILKKIMADSVTIMKKKYHTK